MTPGPDDETVVAALLPVLRELCRHALDAVGQGTLLRDVPGLDSFALIYAVALLEDRFRVQVDASALGSLHTIGDIVRAIVAANPASAAAVP
jgi:acyl carrier protein